VLDWLLDSVLSNVDLRSLWLLLMVGVIISEIIIFEGLRLGPLVISRDWSRLVALHCVGRCYRFQILSLIRL
jgi:hypothetical protein